MACIYNWLQLVEALKGTPFDQRLISAAPIIGPLRSRKTATELERMHHALEILQSDLSSQTLSIHSSLGRRRHVATSASKMRCW